MASRSRTIALSLGLLALLAVRRAAAQDWPQWRGPNRDARAKGFKAPESWPEQLTRKWKVEVGDGVATPALVGGKLYVFARQGGDEVLRCLDAETGKELWQQKQAAAPVSGPASRFSGPRSSPTVADGKVVTLGVEGVLSCHDAASGKKLWRRDEFKGNLPRFAPASSPIVVDGLCIAELGGSEGGGVVALDLATGEEKWKWMGNGPAYGSSVLATLGGTRIILAPTNDNMVALDAAEGKLLWQVEYSQGRYNAATPIVDGDTLILAGPTRGMTAEKLVMKEGKLTTEPLWRSTDDSVQFNTPVLTGGLLYGLSITNSVFCTDAKSGETAWSAPLAGEPRGDTAAGPPRREGGREAGGRGGRGGRVGGPGGGGFGTVVDAGPVLFALTPAGQLAVLRPGKEKLQTIASYKVAEEGTYAHPVIAGNRIYIKDRDSVTLWTTE
ncbi:MAG: PQQ-binding-like beta-propeller repeat protein [Planctomycetes bacterium]|nr:PQQ-binding-like beta-propeller repeat protein [Planctomycetota bacterium]